MHLYQFIYLSLGCKRPNNGESESVDERVQAAQLLTQQPRQHGDHLESDETDTEGWELKKLQFKWTPDNWELMIREKSLGEYLPSEPGRH